MVHTYKETSDVSYNP
jgi:hypothetical protein